MGPDTPSPVLCERQSQNFEKYWFLSEISKCWNIVWQYFRYDDTVCDDVMFNGQYSGEKYQIPQPPKFQVPYIFPIFAAKFLVKFMFAFLHKITYKIKETVHSAENFGYLSA